MTRHNQKMAITNGDGSWKLRITHRKKTPGKGGARFRVKCGDCDQSFDVYYGDDALEINGVYASIEQWQEFWGPLLGMKKIE